MPFPDVFKVFDSHLRDFYGMPSTSGYCVFISIEGHQNLAQYFYLTSPLKHVKVLPYNIYGHCLYSLPCNQTNLMQSSKDGRPWQAYISSS